MSHTEFASNRISQRLASILPEFVRDDAPAFVTFLKAYFEFLESEIITLKSQSDLDGIALEDGQGSVLLEPATVLPSPDAYTSKLISERTGTNTNEDASPFAKGEYLYGETSGTVAKVDVVNGNILYVKSISGSGFTPDETVEGRNTGQTGVVKEYKENSILASNRLLDYSDIDHTTEHFLEYYQKDFLPSIDLKKLKNKRLTIKNISDLYQQKGTEESVKFLMRLLYGQDASVRYPDNETIYVSDSDYNQERRMVVEMDVNSGLPSATDMITEYAIDGKSVLAESRLEAVYTLDADNRIYSLDIQQNHFGVYPVGSEVTFLDRDGVTAYTGTVLGVFTGTALDQGSSTYIKGEDFVGNILYESGEPAEYSGTYNGTQLNTESTHGGGVTTEHVSLGSLYRMNDKIRITGGKLDTDVIEGSAGVDVLTSGGVTEFFIEDGGDNYEPGELIIFDNTNTGGSGADAIIGSTGDEVLLENKTSWGQFNFIASVGQTVFTGVDEIGRWLLFNDENISVFVDGLIKIPITDYSFKNDRVTFTSAMNGGEEIEIYTDFTRLLYEDGSLINFNAYKSVHHHLIFEDGDTIILEDGDEISLESGPTITNDGRIRSIRIQSGGAGYESLPRAYPGGYIYFEDIGTGGLDNKGYIKGETVRGTTSQATARIIRLEPENDRIVVGRRKADTGVFLEGENIEGTVSETGQFLKGYLSKNCIQQNVASGTGADIYAYSEDIGGIASLNITDQGYYFSEDGVVSSTSYYPMLITTPTAPLTRGIVLTGDISGSTGTVISHNQSTHVLTYSDLNGKFFENETVSYNLVDHFQILKSNPYSARGKYAGEGIIQEQLLGDKSTLDADAANLQDGWFYQTHSYVIKVGESINKWRSVLKDLLHPAGHIFFGEVAVENDVDSSMSSQFAPTLIITKNAYAPPAGAWTSSERTVMLWTLDDEVDSLGNLIIRPFTILDEAGIPTTETNPVTGGAISATTYDLVNVSNPAGAWTGENTEIGDSGMRSRHINLNIINSFASAAAQHSARDDITSVLNLDFADNNYLVRWNGVETMTRPADQGKVFPLSYPVDEKLVLEDGGLIELEEEPCILRMEEKRFAEVSGDYGKKVVDEDGETLLRLESATTVEEVHYFTTERSIELTDRHLLFEDGDRMIFEDDFVITHEENSENGISSYVPLGSTMRTLNTISNQRTYKISYYVQNEDDDHIGLEDGIPNGASGYSSTGHDALLDERTESEGLRINQFDTYFPKFFIHDLPKHERKRTNIAFSAYVMSA